MGRPGRGLGAGETLRRVAGETGVEHAFVDLMYLDADAALGLVSAVLEAARR